MTCALGVGIGRVSRIAVLPFRVQCETCNSRLRVNDAAVVGQIHACPKCGSMVLLTPPITEPGAAAAQADSVTAKPTVSAAPVEPSFSASDFESIAELGLPLDGSSVAIAATPLRPSTDGQASSPFVVAPAESTGRWIGLAVAGGGAGLLAVVGVVLYALGGSEEHVSTTAPAPTPSLSVPDELPPVVAEISEPGRRGAASPPAESQPVETPPPVPQVVDARPPALPTETVVAKPAPPETNELADIAVPEPRQHTTASITPVPFDPLDLDASTLGLILTRNPQPEEATEPQEQAAEDPNADLIERLASVAPSQSPLSNIDQRLGDLAADAKAVVRRGPTGPSPAVRADPLKLVIPEIQLADIPLDRAYRLLGSIAGTPITITPSSLRYAAQQADRKVAIRGENQSVVEVLDQLSAPLRLQVMQDGDGLVTRRVGAERARDASYRVDDLLVEDETDASSLVSLLRRLLPETDAEISSKGNRIKVSGSAAAHMEIAILCERLRKARGLKPRSRYPQQLLAVEPLLVELQPRLEAKATFTFVRYTPLAEVFDHWRRASGLTLLVDWRELADINLRPTTTIACSIHNQAWRDALDAVLRELDLAWRPLDRRTLQITSRVAADAVKSVEFYPCDSHAQAGELERSLDHGDTFHYDTASGTALVRANTETHRQLWDQHRAAK